MLLDAASRIASRIRCIQKVAHFSFHTCFDGKAGKYDRQAVDKKIQAKKNKDSVQAKHFSSEKRNCIIKVFPYRTACFGRLTALSSLAAGELVVSQTPRGWRLVKWWRCCCLPFRLLVELAAQHTPSLIVSKCTPAPGLYNLN